MTIAAAMGGAVGVGLLLINTLVVILLWIKLRKKRSKPGSNETMQQEHGNSVIHVIIPSSQEIKQLVCGLTLCLCLHAILSSVREAIYF